MNLLLALLLLAQRGYITDDPVTTTRFGLAVQEGRYVIELDSNELSNCAVWGIRAGWNVDVLGYFADMPGEYWSIVPAGLEEYVDYEGVLIRKTCTIKVGERMSDVPCFQVEGVCDAAAEVDE